MDAVVERDEELMAQTAFGRTSALEVLVRRHSVSLLTFLTRMTGDRHRAEELFQDVFLAVWTKRRQYEFPRPFRPWLYAIALNRCRAAFRVKSRFEANASLDGPEPADDDDSPIDHIIADETARQVADAITRLPPQQRAVVALRVWQELPYARIAEMVGCTEGTVRSHMHHGLAALRLLLQPIIEDSAKPSPEDRS